MLYLQVGKEKKILKSGESAFVPKGTPHKFYNLTNDRVTFRITFEPGHVGMENFIKIIYSLAQDGLTDKKGKPNSFAHLAIILVMSDSNAPGMMSLLSPIIRMLQSGQEKTEPKNGCSINTAVKGDQRNFRTKTLQSTSALQTSHIVQQSRTCGIIFCSSRHKAIQHL